MSPGAVQIVLFGASGDLAHRKLFPALARIAGEHDFQVLGVARGERSDDVFRKEISESLDPGARRAFEQLAPRVHYHAGDVEEQRTFDALSSRLERLSPPTSTGRLFYLGLAPRLVSPTVEGLAEAGLLAMKEEKGRDRPPWRRLVVEKPFGWDRASAHALDRTLHEALREEQIYRIDHYLGKETVQNLLGLRFHNAIFEPLWNRHHVELVQISVAEQIGVEPGRVGYYDRAGALRDVVQSHVLQLLALTAMEPPATLDPDDVRDKKVSALRGLRRLEPAEVRASCVRARYGPGEVGGAQQPGYVEEQGVPEDSTTETFVAVRAWIDSWRWSGVPFLLRHGKRMHRRLTEIQVQFRRPPLQLFNHDGMTSAEFRRAVSNGSICFARPNRLHLLLQPEEGIRLAFGVKQPGPRMHMAPATLAFDYRERFGGSSFASAYDRLLVDALQGDPTLFLRTDELDASWRFIDAIRAGWDAEDPPRLLEYPAGSWGPPEAESLFEGCEAGWSRG